MSEPVVTKSYPRRYRAERGFGLTVGGILAIVGLWWTFRGKAPLMAYPPLGVGLLLVVLGAAYPRALVVPNRLWMKLAEALSFVMTRVILGIVFFLVVTPIGWMRRVSGGDPLRRRSAPRDTYWLPYSERQRNPKHYEKMF